MATFENPAEFLLDVSSIDSPSALLQIADMFKEHAAVNNTNIQDGASRRQAISTCRPFKRASSGVAFWMLLQRNIRNVIRDPLLLIGHMVVTAAISAALALFGANMALDFLGVQTRVFLFNFLVTFDPLDESCVVSNWCVRFSSSQWLQHPRWVH